MEYLNAFLCGGILCAVGQIIIDKTQLTPARILTGYVVVGVLLSALGLYEPLAQWGGAGATVPLTGFGHTLALYAEIYPLRHVMVLGRVASGIGGEWMTETCRRVLAEEYPQLPLEVLLPDDRFRRIGQSVAAASLPQVRP